MELNLFPQTLHFHGPFKFRKGNKHLFDCTFAKSSGIYIWTIKDKGNKNFVEYIGQTQSFAARQEHHLKQILSLNYRIISATSAKEGEVDILWKGLWRMKNTGAITELLGKYEEISHNVIEYVNLLDIYFAPTPTLDENMRCHLEGSIGWNLRNKHPDKATFYPADNHIGVQAKQYNETISITTDERIEGIDETLNL